MAAPISIGTHSGFFHADEALAVSMLRLLPEYASATLVRTRDPALLERCHTVVDVGGVYDQPSFRFDHHQREFTSTFPGRTATRLSSAGLVYLHFGHRVLAKLTGEPEAGENVEVLFQKLYDDFIEPFDANDNGVAAYKPAELGKAGIKPLFKDRAYSVAACVSRFNVAGDDEAAALLVPAFFDTDAAAGQDGSERKKALEDALFNYASAFCGTQFVLAVRSAHRAWLPARPIVRAAYAARQQLHPSGKIIELPYSRDGLPWSEHLYAAEKEESDGEAAQVLYAILPESDEPDTRWRVRAVGVEDVDFVNRKDLPDAWKGVRDEKLAELAGVPGAIFVHASGFIGGSSTREGVLAMATKAVEM